MLRRGLCKLIIVEQEWGRVTKFLLESNVRPSPAFWFFVFFVDFLTEPIQHTFVLSLVCQDDYLRFYKPCRSL